MMKCLKGRERGFSLIELLVAIPIIGMLGMAMGAVLIQLARSDRISQGIISVRQVQVAGDSVSQDGLQAHFVEFGAGGDITSDDWYLNLRWSGGYTDASGNYVTVSENVTYTLVAMSEGNGLYQLERYESYSDSTRVMGQYLDRDQMSCQWEDTNSDGVADTRTFAFKVVSVVGTKTEERTYHISPWSAS